MMPATVISATGNTALHVAPARLPSVQKMMLRNSESSARKLASPIRPPAIEFIATPVRISVTTCVRPPERASP